MNGYHRFGWVDIIRFQHFKEKCPQWILLKYEDKNEVAIHDILHQYYNIVKEDKENKLTLYRYNDNN